MSLEAADTPKALVPNQTDVDLFLALRAGQTACLGILYDRHASLVYGIAFKALRNAQEAEDLTQDIFLSLTKLSAYDPARGTLRTFLAVLTRSRAIDRLRSRQTRAKVLQKWGVNAVQIEATDQTFEALFQTERAEVVQAALAQLPANQQEVLKLVYYEGLSQSKVSQTLDIPLGTVKARARRGLIKLRQIFEKDSGPSSR